MKKPDLLELEIRRRIYNYIQNNPGLHLRELSRRLHISYHNLRYHIDHLKKSDLIVVKTDNSYCRLYIANKTGIKEKKLLNLLRQGTTKNIILTIFIFVICSEKFLSKELNKHQTTISFHLNKLMKADIIERASYNNGVVTRRRENHTMKVSGPVGNTRFYRLKDPDTIYNILLTHNDSLFHDKKLSFIRFFLKLPFAKKLPKQINDPERHVSLIIEQILEIFPHPYHNGSIFL